MHNLQRVPHKRRNTCIQATQTHPSKHLVVITSVILVQSLGRRGRRSAAKFFAPVYGPVVSSALLSTRQKPAMDRSDCERGQARPGGPIHACIAHLGGHVNWPSDHLAIEYRDSSHQCGCAGRPPALRPAHCPAQTEVIVPAHAPGRVRQTPLPANESHAARERHTRRCAAAGPIPALRHSSVACASRL